MRAESALVSAALAEGGAALENPLPIGAAARGHCTETSAGLAARWL